MPGCFHALYQLPIVILRPFMVYGPAQRDERKLIPYVILSLLRGEAPKLTSAQRAVDWVYVDDVIEAFLAAALAPNVEGCTFDIGSGELATVRSVVERIVQIIDPSIEPCFGALPDRPLERVRAAQIARTQSVLGWKQAIPLFEGLRRTADWYWQHTQEDDLEPTRQPAISEDVFNQARVSRGEDYQTDHCCLNSVYSHACFCEREKGDSGSFMTTMPPSISHDRGQEHRCRSFFLRYCAPLLRVAYEYR